MNEVVMTCERCGQIIEDPHGIQRFEANGHAHLFCEECDELGYTVCQECGEIMHKDDLYAVGEYDVCDECRTNIIADWNVCERCGEAIDPDDEHEYVDSDGCRHYICSECEDDGWHVCYECGSVRRWLDTHPEHDEDYICERCLDHLFVSCESCGAYIREYDAHYSDHDEAYYCDSCYDSRGGRVYSYHHAPICYSNYIDNPGDIYYGVELEMGDATESGMLDASRTIEHNFYDIFHMESDCSITDYGFETISIPLTWDKWHKKFDYMQDLYNVFAENGMCADSSCGYHIHVTKSALRLMQWKALAWFMYKHRAMFMAIAGRHSNRFAAYASNRFSDEGNFEDFCSFGITADRYRALNLSNIRTAEFRMFASVENVYDFYRALDIVHYLVEWIKSDRTTTFKMIETPRKAMKEFIEYVAENEENTSYADWLSHLYFHTN